MVDEREVMLRIFKNIDFAKLVLLMGQKKSEGLESFIKSESQKLLQNLSDLYFELENQPKEERAKNRRLAINVIRYIFFDILPLNEKEKIDDEKTALTFLELIGKSLGVNIEDLKNRRKGEITWK